jgi:hypothetical protein
MAFDAAIGDVEDTFLSMFLFSLALVVTIVAIVAGGVVVVAG